MALNMHKHIMSAIAETPLRIVDTDFRRDVESRARSMRVDAAARALAVQEQLSAVSPDFSEFDLTLRAELAQPVPERRMAIDSLASLGSVVTLPSPRKTGKTTFLANLAKAGADEEPFLGAFETHLGGRGVAAINAEMSTEDYLLSFRQFGLRNDNRVRLLHCRDAGLRINLLNDITADRFVKWLTAYEIGWLFLDPLKNFLAWSGTGINDNDAMNLFATRIEEIHAAAGLDLTLIPMHTPQGAQEPGMERGKGAGELEDSADALWRYTRSGPGRDAPRLLAVEGRGGAGLDETVIHFDGASGRLTLGEGDRHAAQSVTRKDRILAAVTSSPGIQTTPLLVQLGGNRNSMSADIRNLQSTGKLTALKQGNATAWYPADTGRLVSIAPPAETG